MCDIVTNTILSQRLCSRTAWFALYFFRRRLALALARPSQGANSDVAGARPLLETRRKPDNAAASAFSWIIRRYSAAVHLPCAINKARCMTVSHDAIIRPVIMAGIDRLFRRRRDFMTKVSPIICQINVRGMGRFR